MTSYLQGLPLMRWLLSQAPNHTHSSQWLVLNLGARKAGSQERHVLKGKHCMIPVWQVRTVKHTNMQPQHSRYLGYDSAGMPSNTLVDSPTCLP
jgi:hypothetical protein